MNPTVLICAGARGKIDSDAVVAEELGEALAVAGFDIITGGGPAGLMHACAMGHKRAGGHPRGISLESIAKRRAPSAEYPVALAVTLQGRQAEMWRLSNAVVVLPGGVGTLSELTEALCQRKLGLADHPVVVLNHRGYFDLFLQQIEQARFDGYLSGAPLFTVAGTAVQAVAQVQAALESQRQHDDYVE
jgi:uncharacterized protein (TIGR00730 family)